MLLLPDWSLWTAECYRSKKYLHCTWKDLILIIVFVGLETTGDLPTSRLFASADTVQLDLEIPGLYTKEDFNLEKLIILHGVCYF